MESDLCILEVAIPGQYGTIEGRLLYHNEDASERGMIICPPHPLLAGNVDNNVVQAVALKMARSLPVLLFNYPAVGRSAHPQPDLPLFEYWHGLDQRSEYDMITEEVKKVIRWSAGYFSRFHLVGYSFGAYMAMTAVTEQTLSYSAIAPPLAEYDFSQIQALSIPVCSILAEHDGLLATPSDLPRQDDISHQTIRDTNHFFLKREDEVAALISKFILAIE